MTLVLVDVDECGVDYCYCGGIIVEAHFINQEDEDIFPQFCSKCGDRLTHFLGFLTKKEVADILLEINNSFNIY